MTGIIQFSKFFNCTNHNSVMQKWPIHGEFVFRHFLFTSCLPNDKILDVNELKAFVDDKIKLA